MSRFSAHDNMKECPECSTFMELVLDEYGVVLDMNPPIYGYDWTCPHCKHKGDRTGAHDFEAWSANEAAVARNLARLAGGWKPKSAPEKG